jgi:hypothetical protein
MDTDARRTRSGQALVEFCIGLVAMLAVIGGVFQLGRMGLARTEARVEATQRASINSMRSEEATGLSIPGYIARVSEGEDEATYSVDDIRVGGNEQILYERLLAPNQPHRLQEIAPGNPLAEMGDSFEMMVGLGLVPGRGAEYDIPVLPIVRRLFFDQPTVDIDVTSWMIRTGDIY